MEENKEEDVKRNTDEPIYVMTVELEKGKNETIKIYIDSKPDELAYDFCKEHNLDFSSLSYLTSQIKALFESLPQANQSNSKQNDECIVEEEDEENQTSEYKGANSNNSNNLIISNEVLKTDTDNFEPVKNLKMLEQSEEQLQDLDEHYQIEDDSKEKKDNDVIYQRASIFSYKEFYKRFKENVILKHNENHFNHTSTCKEKKKEIGKLRPAMTIEQNKKMINNYFKNCCRFDVIYQNKIGDIDLKSSIQDKETSNNNRTCLTASSLKKILNANKEKKETLKSSSMIKDKTMNSFHSNDINYKECRSDSIRLHKECSDKKEKINRKVQRLKQQLLSDTNKFTYYPTKELHTKTSYCTMTSLNTSKGKSSRKHSADNKSYKEYYISQMSMKKKKCLPLPNHNMNHSLDENKTKEIELIYQRKIVSIFDKVFSLLDSDNDDMINIINMNTTRIPISVYNIIHPIVKIIKYNNRDLHRKEFIRNCLKLYDTISFNDKRALLSFGSKI